MKMYVGNLSYTVTEGQLKDMFAEFGKVESANLIMDRMSGQSKGFGYVEMLDNSEADKAMKALNNKDIDGRNLKVNQAKPQEKFSSNNNRSSRY